MFLIAFEMSRSMLVCHNFLRVLTLEKNEDASKENMWQARHWKKQHAMPRFRAFLRMTNDWFIQISRDDPRWMPTSSCNITSLKRCCCCCFHVAFHSIFLCDRAALFANFYSTRLLSTSANKTGQTSHSSWPISNNRIL